MNQFTSAATVALGKLTALPWVRARSVYFVLMIGAVLTIALASFVRERGHFLSNISMWLFALPFAATLWRAPFGLLLSLFLVTVSPALKEQADVLVASGLRAWTYPGVDCCLGFLAAWALRWRVVGFHDVLRSFPSGPILLFHVWVTISAIGAVSRNLCQSASEFSLRGLAYNVWLTRGISWLDDYYPLQDAFFYSVAIALLFAVWAFLLNGGKSFFARLSVVVLAGAGTNLVFGIWQKLSGRGWVNGNWNINLNALWPDLHSFGAFMAIAMLFGYGLAANHASQRKERALFGTATLGAAVGLYLSGSRSTLLLVAFACIAGAIWFSMRLSGWRRALPLTVAVGVVLVIHMAVYFGYRGLSYSMLGERLELHSLNLALSYRPEIWAAALRMYLAYPIFGLGQGAFYRLSSVPDFSLSKFLVGMNGEGVHSEPLRILVELGPIGVGLLLFAAIPVFRLGRANFRIASFYALLGLLLGNLYTNAILVRELLMLGAVFAGSYLWEAQALGPGLWKPPSERSVRYASILLLMFVLASFVEVVASLERNPFVYGQRCHEVKPLAKDGWTQGTLRLPVPPSARSAELVISSARPDLQRREGALDIALVDHSGTVIELERLPLTYTNERRAIEVALPDATAGERLLELKTSNCYVPLNLGVTYDPRRLGVQVHATRFLSADGATIP